MKIWSDIMEFIENLVNNSMFYYIVVALTYVLLIVFVVTLIMKNKSKKRAKQKLQEAHKKDIESVDLEAVLGKMQEDVEKPKEEVRTFEEEKNSDLEDLIDYFEKSFNYFIDNFIPNMTNPEFRDCIVSFDIICHTDYWDIGNYRLRPLKIAGYIDGLLDKTRLTGIGTFQFLGCSELVLDENLSGYTLMYSAVHGSDDEIPNKE